MGMGCVGRGLPEVRDVKGHLGLVGLQRAGVW